MTETIRMATIYNNNEATSNKRTSVLTVDSGWDKDWIALKAKVDAIVLHCSERLTQDMKADEIKSCIGADGKVPDNCNPTPNQTPKINDKNEPCICTPFAIDINPNCKAQTHKL